MLNYPQKSIEWILSVIFPKICLGCHKFTEKYEFDYVCKKCFREIKIKNVFECIECKKEVKLGLTCVPCRKDNNIDQLIITANLSDPLIDKIVKAFKYKFIPDMSKPLSVLIKKRIKYLLFGGFNIFQDAPLFVSVPLHKKRLNWRGFNQAELLAQTIANSYHLSYFINILARTTDRKHQADIKIKEERLNNVKNNFIVTNTKAIRDRNLILIDDVCTTGATLNECAKILKKGGAKKVIGLVIARG